MVMCCYTTTDGSLIQSTRTGYGGQAPQEKMRPGAFCGCLQAKVGASVSRRGMFRAGRRCCCCMRANER